MIKKKLKAGWNEDRTIYTPPKEYDPAWAQEYYRKNPTSPAKTITKPKTNTTPAKTITKPKTNTAPKKKMETPKKKMETPRPNIFGKRYFA